MEAEQEEEKKQVEQVPNDDKKQVEEVPSGDQKQDVEVTNDVQDRQSTQAFNAVEPQTTGNIGVQAEETKEAGDDAVEQEVGSPQLARQRDQSCCCALF